MSDRPGFRFIVIALASFALFPSMAAAQSDGAPVPPAVASQDESGRVSLRAVRLERPLEIDGQLDEPIYGATAPIDHFVQQVPERGLRPARRRKPGFSSTTRTSIFPRVACDSQPERIVANELRHDSSEHLQRWRQHHARSRYVLRPAATACSSRPIRSAPSANRPLPTASYIESWNTVWQVQIGPVRRMAGPPRWRSPSSRCATPDSGPQIWGINFRRVIRWKNEYSDVTPMPASFGPSGLASNAASPRRCTGCQTPARSRNLELKPYVVSSVTTDTDRRRAVSQPTPTGDIGGDLKYGLSRSLTADVTINTDFAQVEEDVTAGQPDALQPASFPRSATSSSRARAFSPSAAAISGRGSGDTGDVAGDVLQPADRIAERSDDSGDRRWPRHRARLGDYDGRRIEHRNRRAGVGAQRRSTNFTAVRVQARHPAAQQHRRDCDESARRAASARQQRPVWRRRKSFACRKTRPCWGIPTHAADRIAGERHGRTSYRARLDYAGDRYGLIAEHLLVDDGFTPAVGYTRRAELPAQPRGRSASVPGWKANRVHAKAHAGKSATRTTRARPKRGWRIDRSDGRFGIEFHSGDHVLNPISRERGRSCCRRTSESRQEWSFRRRA